MATIPNNKPLFAITPVFSSVQIATANTNRDGITGIYGELITVARKTLISEIRYKAIVNTTAGMVRIFVTDTAGANPRMLREIQVAVATVSATVQGAEGSITFDNLVLNTGQKILVSTHNAETINVFVLGGELETEV